MEPHIAAGTGVVARARRLKRYLWHEPNPLVQIFYLLLVVGGYGAFLLAGLPHLPNTFLSKLHIGLSGAVVLLAMHSFIVASTTSPGILTPQTIPFFDNYALDGVLYATPQRNCITCKTAKPARSKHCAVCNVCVPRFDHHCVWLNACIGERNHRHFLYFLVANVVLCAYGSYVLFFILYDQFQSLRGQPFVDAESGQVIQGVTIVELRFLIHAEAVLFVLWVMCTLMGVAVRAFFLFHCYLVMTNTTTNEFFKWRSLKADQDALRRQRRRQVGPPVDPVCFDHIYSLGSVLSNVKEVFSPRCDQRLREHLARRAKPKTT